MLQSDADNGLSGLALNFCQRSCSLAILLRSNCKFKFTIASKFKVPLCTSMYVFGNDSWGSESANVVMNVFEH